jgi:uncharacterized membrane protein
MNQGPPADFGAMADRILGVMPILVVGIAVLGLAIWLFFKWRHARNFAKYGAVVDEVRNSSGGTLSDSEVYDRALPKYLEELDRKTMRGHNTKDKK